MAADRENRIGDQTSTSSRACPDLPFGALVLALEGDGWVVCLRHADPPGQIVYVSPLFLCRLGSSPEAAEGLLEDGVLLSLVQPADRPALQAALEGLRRGESSEVEGQFAWQGDPAARTRLKMFPVDGGLGLERLQCLMLRTTAREYDPGSTGRQEALLKSILDHIPFYVFWKDRESRYLGCNSQFARAAGLGSVAEIVGMTDFDLPWTNEEAVWYRKCDQDVMEDGVPLLDIEETQLQADGSRTYLRTHKVPLKNSGGDVFGILGIYADISDWHDAIEELRLLRAAFEAAAYGIVVTKKDGTIVWANSALSDLTGYESAEILGKTPSMLKSDEHEASFYRELWETVLSGRIWAGEIRNRRKDGRIYDEHMTVTPVRNPQGEITHFIAIKQDVTDRKLAEAQMARSKSEMETLLAAIHGMLIALDHRGQIQSLNRMAEELLAVRVDQARGARLVELADGWSLGGLDQAVRDCLISQRAVELGEETEATLADGQRRFFSVTLTPLSEASGERSVLLVAMERTQHRMLQAQLLQAQKLEAIGQLAAGIAHEINTPIQFVGDNLHFLGKALESMETAVDAGFDLWRIVDGVANLREAAAGFRERLAESDVEFMRSEASQAVLQALEGVRRVATIVQAMKEFSHPDTEEMQPADLNRAVESTVTVARNEYKYVADVILDLAPELPTVFCDIGEINQVILNMLINAAHAVRGAVGSSGRKGEIRISTRAVDEEVEIRIEDTGVGIRQEILGRIFEPFFTTKGVGEGTGQGLAMAYSTVVDKHGGKITVESVVGRGSVFTVRIPAMAGEGSWSQNARSLRG